MIRRWYRFWIWVLYLGGLRGWLNDRQRALARDDRTPKKPLVELLHPSDLQQHLADFDWRKDGTRVGGFFFPMDYVSHSQVFEARLADGKPYDGDCDDVHHYAAVQLLRMHGVDDALHVSIGYPGGGHMACVYLFRRKWWLLNYQKIHALPDGPQDAERVLMKWAGHEGKRARWLVFENTKLKRVRL